MDALAQRSLDRIEERTNFSNANVKALVIGHTKKSFALAVASSALFAKTASLGMNAVETTAALDGIARQFGELESTPPNETRKAAVKGFMKDLIDEDDPELERLMEEYFDADYELETSFNEINAGVDAEIAAGGSN